MNCNSRRNIKRVIVLSFEHFMNPIPLFFLLNNINIGSFAVLETKSLLTACNVVVKLCGILSSDGSYVFL